MKVLFLIYSHGPATGGHFHSLDTISRHLGNRVEVGIVSIGSNVSPVLEANPCFSTHLTYGKGIGYPAFLKELKTCIRSFGPDVVHCFDAAALCLAAPVIGLGKYKVVLNKCGGPNPVKNRWVYCKDIVFFSLENYEWFKGADFYKNVSLHLIPNRVEKLPGDIFENKLTGKDPSKFNLVRITRISPDYWHTMQLSVKLAAFFAAQKPTKLFVIGRVYDRAVFDELLKYAANLRVDIEVITDERANKAVKMLYLADAVVGTGRSIMEAMSFGLPVMAPAVNCDLPVLISAENFQLFFRGNFSERVKVSDEMERNNPEILLSVANSGAALKNAGIFAREMFDRFFNVSHAVEKYREVYRGASANGNTKLISRNLKYIAREIINAGKR